MRDRVIEQRHIGNRKQSIVEQDIEREKKKKEYPNYQTQQKIEED
jgi:hypothetical protein